MREDMKILIAENFTALLEKEDIDKITVKELPQRRRNRVWSRRIIWMPFGFLLLLWRKIKTSWTGW